MKANVSPPQDTNTAQSLQANQGKAEGTHLVL